MKYKGRRQSANVEDRRGMSTGRKIGIRGGIGTIIVAIVILLFGGDLSTILGFLQTEEVATSEVGNYVPSDSEKELAEFISVVLADTEDVWHTLFRKEGESYREPKLVLFSNKVESACGFAGAATGPFYCPADEKIYIDLGFLEKLQEQLGAQGDFAVAYIVAHEVGHHVQNLAGTLDKVHSLRQRLEGEEYNEQNVRLELQADFFAGVWAHHAQRMKNILDEGDIEEAMNAANAVGDDRLQMRSRGYVVPDSFTHGTSKQRMKWFKRGFETGNLNQGDTFNLPI